MVWTRRFGNQQVQVDFNSLLAQRRKNTISGNIAERLPGGMCLRSFCTLDRHPVSAAARFLRSSSSSAPPPPRAPSISSDGGGCGDAGCPSVVSAMGRMSMTQPQVSTRWTVAARSAVGCFFGACWRSLDDDVGTATSADRTPRPAAAHRKAAAGPPPTVFTPPLRWFHGTLPRGMLL